MFHGHHDLGIIGGPDGPTAVFVTHHGSVTPALAALVLLVLAAGIVWFLLRRRRRK